MAGDILARRKAERTYQQVMSDTAPIPKVGKMVPYQDTGSMMWFLFGLFFPPLGLITWFFNRKESPVSCKRILKGIIAGIIAVGLLMVSYFGLRSWGLNALSEQLASFSGGRAEMPVLECGSGQEGISSITADGYTVQMV